jgi:hypothetical protein
VPAQFPPGIGHALERDNELTGALTGPHRGLGQNKAAAFMREVGFLAVERVFRALLFPEREAVRFFSVNLSVHDVSPFYLFLGQVRWASAGINPISNSVWRNHKKLIVFRSDSCMRVCDKITSDLH